MRAMRTIVMGADLLCCRCCCGTRWAALCRLMAPSAAFVVSAARVVLRGGRLPLHLQGWNGGHAIGYCYDLAQSGRPSMFRFSSMMLLSPSPVARMSVVLELTPGRHFSSAELGEQGRLLPGQGEARQRAPNRLV